MTNSMLKSKKVIVNEMIESNKNNIAALEIRESFLQQKEILAKSGKSLTQLDLGQIQSQIRENKEWVEWLEKYEKELK